MKTELASLREIKNHLKSPEFYKTVLQCLISWDWGFYEYAQNYIILGDGKKA